MGGWLEFVVGAVGGACAFVCLYEGVRRLRGPGGKGTALLMALFGAGFYLAYGGLAYWKHRETRELADDQRRLLMADLRTGGGTLAGARTAFAETGEMRHYVDASGRRMRFQPGADDIKRRDFTVAVRTRNEESARASLREAWLWLIWGACALAFGLYADPRRQAR